MKTINNQFRPSRSALQNVQSAYNAYNIFLSIVLLATAVRVITFYLVRVIDKTSSQFGPINLTLQLIGWINLVALIFVLISVYNLGKQIKLHGADKTLPVLWVVIMFFPLFNLIAILIMYRKTRKLISQLKSKEGCGYNGAGCEGTGRLKDSNG